MFKIYTQLLRHFSSLLVNTSSLSFLLSLSLSLHWFIVSSSLALSLHHPRHDKSLVENCSKKSSWFLHKSISSTSIKSSTLPFVEKLDTQQFHVSLKLWVSNVNCVCLFFLFLSSGPHPTLSCGLLLMQLPVHPFFVLLRIRLSCCSFSLSLTNSVWPFLPRCELRYQQMILLSPERTMNTLSSHTKQLPLSLSFSLLASLYSRLVVFLSPSLYPFICPARVEESSNLTMRSTYSRDKWIGFVCGQNYFLLHPCPLSRTRRAFC